MWDRGEPLIEQELEAIVVRSHDELTPPKIWAPVAHRLDEANKLSLLRCKLAMPRSDLEAEEGNWAAPLVQNRAKPRSRCIALNNEGTCEVW